MYTKQLISEVKIDKTICRLSMQGETALVDFDGQSYAFLWHLIQVIPSLSDAAHIDEFAKISNFYWKAGKFRLIENIAEYQEFYLNRVELEKKHPADLYDYRLTDYKIFDVSCMHQPKIDQGQLNYFTYNETNGIPYRVVCSFPYHLNQAVHYQILPVVQ